MTPSTQNIYVDTFLRLATVDALPLPGVESAKRITFITITAAAALAFTGGRGYAETEVNALLKEWLAGPGAMLATDHVELRRCLVDCRLLERDGFGHRYARTPAPEAWREALAALAGIDLGREAAVARAADRQRRAERKAQWEERTRQAVDGR